ncbi:hypothetical protein [Radicibacter daui]|uniref:hypothetical protein n=1 Tax=Radicibacter daui TaxID=3064829 RepID=UPI004046FDB3
MVISPELNAITLRYQRAASRQTALAFLRDREAELRQLREVMRSACQPENRGEMLGGTELQSLWPHPETAPRLQGRQFALLR